MQLLNIFLTALFFGLLAARLATKRGRKPLHWFIIGALFSGLGILSLFLLPKIAPIESPPLSPVTPKEPRYSEYWHKLWYYVDLAHLPQGPFAFSDFVQKWQEKQVTASTYVWGEGMQEWKKLADLPDLVTEFQQK
jgi:hypothetical protein